MSKRHWLNFALFLLISFPLCISLSALDRYPGIIGEKLAYYQKHHREFDTLIVGSSYMQFGVDPAELDRMLRGNGINSSAMNLAVSGLMAHEIDEMLRLALKADRSRNLERVIIDLRPSGGTPNPAHLNTEFEVWWHSPYQTFSAIESLWKSKVGIVPKLRLTVRHLKLMAENYLPISTAHRLGRLGRADREGGWFWESMREYRGFEPISVERRYHPFREDQSNVAWIMILQRDRMLANPETLNAGRRRVARLADQYGDLEYVNVAFWQRQAARLRRRNIVPVYTVMPSYNGGITPVTNALARRGVLPHYLSFNDPRRYPALFAIENRYEYGHLNETGASILSRKLGGEIARSLRGGPSSIEPPLQASPTHVAPRPARSADTWPLTRPPREPPTQTASGATVMGSLPFVDEKSRQRFPGCFLALSARTWVPVVRRRAPRPDRNSAASGP